MFLLLSTFDRLLEYLRVCYAHSGYPRQLWILFDIFFLNKYFPEDSNLYQF